MSSALEVLGLSLPWIDYIDPTRTEEKNKSFLAEKLPTLKAAHRGVVRNGIRLQLIGDIDASFLSVSPHTSGQGRGHAA